MESLQKSCIDTFVKKGSPELLSDKLPPVLYCLIVNKIMSNNKESWIENINLVHLDLLINRRKLFLNVETNYGELNLVYSSPNEDASHLNTFKLYGNIYNFLDNNSKKLYDTTIKYLKEKGEYESIERDLALSSNIYRKKEIKLH